MSRGGRGGPGAGCGLLLARGTASPGLRRWLGSPRLLCAGRPPSQSVRGPPGAPPAGLGPLRGRQARDWRVLLSEQTVHLGCSRCGVTAPGAPQPVRVPASQLVSFHRVPLSMAHAHEESQGEGQEARDPTAGRRDGARWDGARTADLHRAYLLPLASGTPGCVTKAAASKVSRRPGEVLRLARQSRAPRTAPDSFASRPGH
uniref:Uncharacterized protein n=1 Tax=Neovison vison TaxID=452646 RepID=A0A8C7BKS9_NEOVI